MGLWNCQSVVNKVDFISDFSLQSTLSIMGLTETWIRPEDSATPAALSNNFSFSHTPRQVGRGGGTGLLSMLHNFLSRPFSFLGWTTAMLFWLDFHQAQSNRYKWFRMQRHDWSSTCQKEPMFHLSLSPYTGYRLQLASSSKHWCLHIEQPQAQHPPTSTHWWQSTSPPEVWDPLVSDEGGEVLTNTDLDRFVNNIWEK